MSILLGKYNFVGPYLDPHDVLDEPGLLAVLVQIGEEFELLELKESASLKQCAERIFNDNSILGILSVAAHHLPDSDHKSRCRLRAEIMIEFVDDETPVDQLDDENRAESLAELIA